MKQPNGWACFAMLGLGLASLVLPGCSQSPAPVKNTKAAEPVEDVDPLQAALEPLRKTETAAGFRDALRPLDAYLQRPETRAQVQLTAEDRKVLSTRFNLDKDELAEIEAGFYRPLDGFHLEECFLLRDAARVLRQPGAPALMQAELCLDWVCRQVLLRESVGALTPPAYLLRQGHGSARERALVFLALLHQLQIPGCVLAWPEAAPGGARTVLAGVVAGTADKSAIYLFDPRLGKPVPGPEGKGIATLGQFRKQPALFPVNKEDAAARPEVLFACSLHSLAPRMRFLERRLAAQEPAVLSVEPAKALARLEQAAGEAVGVWNPPAAADPSAANSPVRMMRHFQPTADGGLDGGVRRGRFDLERTRMSDVRQRLADFGLWGQRALLLNPEAQARSLGLARELFRPYVVEARDLLLRGQYERVAKRLDMLASAYDDLEFLPLEQQDFVRRIQQWCDRVNKVYLAKVRALPDAQKAQAMVESLWNDDQYFVTLVEAQEKPNPQKQNKTIVSLIFLSALKDSLGAEARYLQAQNWQEQAERTQATWQRLVAGGDTARARKLAERSQELWQAAVGWWGKFVERAAFDLSTLPARVKIVRDLRQRDQLQQVTSVWNQLMMDVHRSTAARLNLARCLELEGKKNQALSLLGDLAQDLAALRANADLQQEVAEFSKRAIASDVSKEFVQSLARDLGPRGGIAAADETVQRRIREIKAR